MNQVSSVSTDVFDRWAEVYDTQANPLLALEQRVLGPMLADVRGLDILDVGCGTGRWLKQLIDCSPRSLLGVDISPAMLLLAAIKLDNKCDLRVGCCTDLPVGDASADLVLASFVVSYVHDLEAFAEQIHRVTRPGATVVLTDMHPDTEVSSRWKRSFQTEGSVIQIQGLGWSLHQIMGVFQARGFKLVALHEPTFDLEDRPIFEQGGRPDLYEAAQTLPAIYVLQLRKLPSSPRPLKVTNAAAGSILLRGVRYALGPEASISTSVSIAGGVLRPIQSQAGLLSESNLDLSGFLLLPGLINAHDHLDFSLFPNIGEGPYENATQWAHSIHANNAPVISRHRKVARSIRLWWGGIRNLLCGVTTVCHHNPVSGELRNPGFPVRVISEFGWAHSPSLDPDLARKFAESPLHLPFILHAAEGVDERSSQEVFDLDHMQALDYRTVLVHGLACTPEAVALINRRLAAVILCPTSNKFLFHRSPTLEFIRSLETVALGSDSPLTAAGDLLDEIRFARTEIGLDANSLYGMVTTQAAKLLWLRRGEGRLGCGSVADMVAVRHIGLSPAETLAQLTMEQIELVMIAGRIQLVGPSIYDRLPGELRHGLQLFEVDGHQRWVRAPINKLLAEAEEALGSDLCLGGKRVRRAAAA